MEKYQPELAPQLTDSTKELALELREQGFEANFEDWDGLNGNEIRRLVLRIQGVDIGEEWAKIIDEERRERSDEV